MIIIIIIIIIIIGLKQTDSRAPYKTVLSLQLQTQ